MRSHCLKGLIARKKKVLNIDLHQMKIAWPELNEGKPCLLQLAVDRRSGDYCLDTTSQSSQRAQLVRSLECCQTASGSAQNAFR